LAEGLRKLSELLFEAGAVNIWPAMSKAEPLLTRDELSKLPNVLPNGLANLMTIHLFSSCPMGENKSRCAVDSFGRVHGFKDLFVADASLLCSAPGVNPQGSVMGLVRRNVSHFLKNCR
jgi:choline dehydrogenase-like flavoprotein